MDDFIREHWSTAVTVLVVAVLLGLVIKVLSPKKKVFAEDMTLNVRCRCGWQGTVTKYNRVCRKCNSRDVELMN